MRAATAGNQAKIDFRQAKARIASGDTIVAAKGQFKASAQRYTVDSCDHRLWALLDQGNDVPGHRPGLRCGGVELTDICPAREPFSRAHEYGGVNVRVFHEALYACVDATAASVVQAVYRRIIDGDDGHAILHVVAHRRRQHGEIKCL
ncbi:hypothetical protein D3C72_1241780 [compost metagenome]